MKSKNVITVDLAMELNVGKVMNFAHKAGLPKVKRAFPSMALGTSEATPLQMAEAYTGFANLGDKVSPLAISRVTTGDGRTVVAPTVERRNIMRPDVAYIMNDIMKDVINRGTAAKAKAWGFKNVEGKRGYAGKTGTSRDGWFAGFTPELVVVVYVGFDDGSDLRLDGSESAMPIWAEFMRGALRKHPEWNGDWVMPQSIQRAEIDIRNGNVIRTLTDKEADLVEAQKKVIDAKSDGQTAQESEVNTVKDLYISSIPDEFRRIELFVSGTLPTKMILPIDAELDKDKTLKKPKPTATPFTTWEDAEAGQDPNVDGKKQRVQVEEVTVMFCPLTKKRAIANCPQMTSINFKRGEEPKEFCKFHVNSPIRKK